VAPFGGRSLRFDDVVCEIVASQCSVVWGAPAVEILPVVDAFRPDIVISLGEALDNFRIETVARRDRGADRADNRRALPFRTPIVVDGEPTYAPCFDAERVKRAVDADALDVPLVLSTQAGQVRAAGLTRTSASTADRAPRAVPVRRDVLHARSVGALVGAASSSRDSHATRRAPRTEPGRAQAPTAVRVGGVVVALLGGVSAHPDLCARRASRLVARRDDRLHRAVAGSSAGPARCLRLGRSRCCAGGRRGS
jgi:hypothetical protein